MVLFSDIDGTKNYFKALEARREDVAGVDPVLWGKVYNIIYLGSDSWSTDSEIFQTYYGRVFSRFIGVGVYTKDIAGFRAHLAGLNAHNYNPIYQRLRKNYFLEYLAEYNTTASYTASMKDLDDHTSTTADATYAFGRGIAEYVAQHNITSSRHANTSLLLDTLKQLTFTSLTGNQVSFGSRRAQVGRYYIVQYSNNTFSHPGNYTSQTGLVFLNPYRHLPSICSAQCAGGQWRKSTSPCCHECVACSPHSISNGSTGECTVCPDTYTHNTNHTECVPVTPAYIPYLSLFAALLYLLVVAGLAAVAAITVIFCAQFNTPVVQGHGVFIYATLLSACVLLLASSLLFLGEHSFTTCNLQVAAPLLGLSSLFLCVVCLTKTVILRLRALHLTRFYIIQLSILVAGLAIQAAVISLVLYTRPMQYIKTEIRRGVVHGRCMVGGEGYAGPGLYIMYISTFLLSLTALALSFLGRNINENYNEGKFLAFQTLAMHIVMVAFVPTVNVLSGPTLSGAWAVTIVLICYIVLIVLFTPKLYIILYRPYKNRFLDELTAPLPHSEHSSEL